MSNNGFIDQLNTWSNTLQGIKTRAIDKLKSLDEYEAKVSVSVVEGIHLSICLTIKNRCLVKDDNYDLIPLFPVTLKSIVNSIKPEDCVEIIIADWESSDWPLEDWVFDFKRDNIDIRIIQVPRSSHGFSRGEGLNAAGDAASCPVIFFTDAEMFVNRDLLRMGYEYCMDDAAYFPGCRFLNKEYKRRDKAGPLVLGNVFITNEIFKNNRWHEKRNWGKEDGIFKRSLKQKGVKIIRNHPEGFYHIWHPEKIEWKNRFTKNGIHSTSKDWKHALGDYKEHRSKWLALSEQVYQKIKSI